MLYISVIIDRNIYTQRLNRINMVH